MLKRRAKARKILDAASIALVTYLAPAAWAATVYVDISGQYWPWGYRLIQQGINAASDGDTVQVMGVGAAYPENIHFQGKDIVVTGIGPTVIQGRGDGPTVTFAGTESETCVLQGFIIQGGVAENGGGICGGTPEAHTHATIRNNLIFGNQAEDAGGGIAYCDGLIRNNTIAQNHAAYGGGLAYCGGTMLGNRILVNVCDSFGGGLYVCEGTIQNNEIAGNSSGWQGGGLYDCEGMIQDNEITGNSSESGGGGLSNCNGVIQKNNIRDNSATGSTASGGGLYFCDGPIQNNTITGNAAAHIGGGLAYCNGTITNNTITGNSTADYGGGGLGYCDGTIQNNAITGNSGGGDYGGGGLVWCEGTIQNNTIAGNTSTSRAGGLEVCKGTIRNCVIWGNEGEGGYQLSGSSDPTYSCVQNWIRGGEGNTSEDPQFVDPDGPDNDPKTYEDNNYRLSYGSPCIDAGDNSALPTPPGLDLDGNLRVVIGEHSLTVDMGAYEYNSGPLRIQAILRFGASAAQLTWRSQPNDTYTIWSRDDLVTGTWIEAGTVPSHGAETPWIDAAASGHMKFYRIEMK
jgi:hypothetical protein